MTPRHLKCSALMALCGLVPGSFGSVVRAAEVKDAANKFEKDIVAFENADRKTPPPTGAILFAGDSQFTRWKSIHEDLKEYTVINRGFGGSKMSDLLHYADRIVIPYRPRIIVINEGGNDIQAGRTPEELLADFKTFVEKVHPCRSEARHATPCTRPAPHRSS